MLIWRMFYDKILIITLSCVGCLINPLEINEPKEQQIESKFEDLPAELKIEIIKAVSSNTLENWQLDQISLISEI